LGCLTPLFVFLCFSFRKRKGQEKEAQRHDQKSIDGIKCPLGISFSLLSGPFFVFLWCDICVRMFIYVCEWSEEKCWMNVICVVICVVLCVCVMCVHLCAQQETEPLDRNAQTQSTKQTQNKHKTNTQNTKQTILFLAPNTQKTNKTHTIHTQRKEQNTKKKRCTYTQYTALPAPSHISHIYPTIHPKKWDF
jgi:hypothetical protein